LPGGILTSPAEQLWEEVAHVAYRFHWSLDEILDLEHPLRRRFVGHIRRMERADRADRESGQRTVR
jgi:hypothetical protein